jgi:hypothetical protein
VLAHPQVGRLELIFESYAIPDAPGQMLIVYMTEPESASAMAMERLQALVNPPSRAAGHSRPVRNVPGGLTAGG